MINNAPRWIEIDVEGDITGDKYFGRFCIKPFLTHAERADAVRLAEKYCRGIDRSLDQQQFLTTLAFLKFHVTDFESKWWEEDGLSLIDESPVYAISNKVRDIQNPEKDNKKTKQDDGVKDEDKKTEG